MLEVRWRGVGSLRDLSKNILKQGVGKGKSCSLFLTNICSCFIVHSLGMGLFLIIDGPALVCEWINFPIVWPHIPVQTKLK